MEDRMKVRSYQEESMKKRRKNLWQSRKYLVDKWDCPMYNNLSVNRSQICSLI